MNPSTENSKGKNDHHGSESTGNKNLDDAALALAALGGKSIAIISSDLDNIRFALLGHGVRSIHVGRHFLRVHMRSGPWQRLDRGKGHIRKTRIKRNEFGRGNKKEIRLNAEP